MHLFYLRRDYRKGPLSLKRFLLLLLAWMKNAATLRGRLYRLHESGLNNPLHTTGIELPFKLQNELSLRHNQKEIGKIHEVLIEGDSKRSDEDYKGRTSQNKVVVFPKSGGFKPGDYVQVKIEEASSATLIGKIVQVVESDSLV
jgi:hypothetical protein